MRSWFSASGSRPNIHWIGCESIARTTSSSTTVPLTIATLSRLSLIHAI